MARNCLIVNCTGTGRAGGIDFYGNGGVAENCTVINCTSTSSTVAGGVHSIGGGGTLRNCIVYGCSNKGGESNITGGPAVEYTATAPLQSGEGNIALAAMPKFADPENGDYHVTAGATIDAGLNQSWMQTWGDLAGSPRILNGRVDMGAYEYSSEGAPLTVAIEPSAPFALLGGEIALSAIVAPPDATGLSYTWTVTDHGSGTTVFTTNGTGCATFSRTYPLGTYDVALAVMDDQERSATETAEEVFSVKPHTVWVDGAASATYPYDTKATGFTTVAEAVDFAEDGMSIVLADGEHPNTAAALVVGRGVKIAGEHGADTTTYYTTASLTIDNAAAVFSGITIKSDYKHHDHNVHIANGTLDSCIITNWYRNYDTLVVSGGGLVTNCLLTGCATYANDNLIDVEGGSIVNTRIVGNKITGGTYGAAIRLTGGLVRGCLIAGNETRANTNSKGAIIYMNAPGTVESCTFADNRDLAADRCPAVWIPSTGGTVRNCIVMGNVNVDGAPIGFNADAAAAATHTLTDVPGLTGVGCKTEVDLDRVFKKHTAGDYRLSGVSPAVNAGLNQSWMIDALDLGGNPRIIGKTADIGCLECTSSAGTILLLQ